MNHLLLHLLAGALDTSLDRAKIGPARLLRPLLVVPMGRGRWMVAILSTPGPFCFLAESDPLEGEGEAGFKRIAGRTIASVSADRDERALRCSLAESDTDECLAFYPFGNSTRIRVETSTAIVESLDVNETGVALEPRRGSLRALEDTDIAPFVDGSAIYLSGSGRKSVPVAAPGDDTIGPFEDAIAACASIAGELVDQCKAQIIDREAAVIQRHVDKQTRRQAQLEADLEKANNFEVGRNEANILAAYQSRIDAGRSSVELPDLYNSGENITIELDPATPIGDQIQKRFKKAAKLERGREVLRQRVRTTATDIKNVSVDFERALAASSFAESYRALVRIIDKHRLRKQSKRPAGTTPERTYRQFELSPEWFAIVGRSDKENDEITFKVARPNDIWLHAQQIAGSHVVLRSRGAGGNPPERVLELAAGIAAHFSKAKHSNLVPVIYTLRKYVRKFRGAKPGQVTCEREKTIFAEPGLPAE